MKTTDLNSPISSHKLNENMYKKFGVKVDFERYTREQLEDYRNLLRTKIFQQEAKANFNDLLANETYQKDKHLVGLLNTKIKEMLGESKKRKDLTGDGKNNFDDVQAARMQAGGVPKKKAIAKATSDDLEEGFPTVDDAKKAAAGTAGMKQGEKKKSSTGGEITKTATGLKHTAGKNYGGKDAPKAPDSDKKVKEGFPTVDDAKKASQGTAGMKAGDKKKSSTGGTIEKTKTGIKHTAGKNYGGMDAPKTPDSDKKVKEAFKDPDQAKLDKNKNGKLDKKDFELLRKGKKQNMKESQYKQHVKMVNENLRRLLSEDEEGKAKTITAGADMVNDFTTWMTRIGQYQTKSMIELADTIRANFGQQEAETFKAAVAPSLETALNTLTQCREEISQAVAVLAGEAPPTDPMGGMGDEMGGMGAMDGGMEDPAMDGGDMDGGDMGGDEFGAADAAAGGGEISGRVRRESRELFARKLSEAHSIVSRLSK